MPHYLSEGAEGGGEAFTEYKIGGGGAGGLGGVTLTQRLIQVSRDSWRVHCDK